MSADLKIISPGVYDLPSEVYHADPVGPEASLSASIARLLIEATPLHAWTASPRLNPDAESENKTVFDLGRAAHRALTGKGGPIVTIDAADYRTNAAKEARDAAYAAGGTPLLAEQAVQVRAMVVAARRQMRQHGIGDPFEGGANEMTLAWRADDVWNRAMVDCLDLENRVQYDLKTTGEYADPSRWIRRGMEYGIDLRAAHYLDGTNALLDEGWRYRLILLETRAPHALSVVELTGDTLDLGARKLAAARASWRRSLDTGAWPAWSTSVLQCPAPIWHATKWIEREASEDVRAAHPGQRRIPA